MSVCVCAAAAADDDYLYHGVVVVEVPAPAGDRPGSVVGDVRQTAEDHPQVVPGALHHQEDRPRADAQLLHVRYVVGRRVVAVAACCAQCAKRVLHDLAICN